MALCSGGRPAVGDMEVGLGPGPPHPATRRGSEHIIYRRDLLSRRLGGHQLDIH